MRGSDIKIGVVTASVSRLAGGLFWSVRSLATGVRNQGCDVEVFSVADQYSDQDAAQWRSLDVHLMARFGPRAFGYAPGFGSALDNADLELVHTHGLWMYPSMAASRWGQRWNKPLVVSPRGMLDAWAVRNSAWKKRLAGLWFEDAHLKSVACMHALSESELDAIRRYGLSNPVAVIPNAVDLPDKGQKQPEPDWAADLPNRNRVLLFVGRLHPKKGLINLLHAWGKVKKRASRFDDSWCLVIAGWDQGGHQAELERLARDLKVSNSVHFIGPQFNKEKAVSFSYADAFILPSFSEGLPMAILEAWSYKLPVLMTRQCNLPEGFEVGAAIEMEPEPESIVEALNYLFHLPREDRLAIGRRGHNLVAKKFSWSTASSKMVEVYAWVLGRAPKPGCVITD